jgi:hypothetical protein
MQQLLSKVQLARRHYVVFFCTKCQQNVFKKCEQHAQKFIYSF